MKRYRWILIIALLAAGWLGAECFMHWRIIPPDRAGSLDGFLRWSPYGDQFKLVSLDGHDYLIAYGSTSGLLPSGPAGYVFDRSGKLIAWSADIGDDPIFDERWHAQGITAARMISRVQAATWPATRPEK